LIEARYRAERIGARRRHGSRPALPILPNGRYRARITGDGAERLLDEIEWREHEWRFD
jgi:hypothetical protein